MRTQQRLTRAYEQARVEEFDERSKYVFFSDCHRADGGLSDEFTRNENAYRFALQKYFDDGYVYVEVGDGDELWEQPSYRLIVTAHFDTYREIKRFFDHGRLVLIWGNHNNYLRDSRYVAENLYFYRDDHTRSDRPLFEGIQPVESLLLRHRSTGQEVLVVHGHQGDFTNDQGWFPTMLSLRFFWGHLKAMGIRNPASPARSAFKRHRIERNFGRWIAKHRRALICGHTHRAKYPGPGEMPYFNAGSCIYPASVTAIELSHGDMCLVRWRVLPDPHGVLQVQREVLRGPEPLSSFDARLWV